MNANFLSQARQVSVPLLCCWLMVAGNVPGQPPRIASVTPLAAPAGSVIALAGENFNATVSNPIVRFGAVRGSVLSGSADSLTVEVPLGATFAPLVVTVDGLTAYAPDPFLPTFNGLPGLDGSSFGSAVTLQAAWPHKVEIGDLDGDGWPDLVASSYTEGYVSVYRNLGAGGALGGGSFNSPVYFATSPGAYWVTLGDVDGDGRLDIAVVNRQSDSMPEATDTVSVLRNTSQPGAIDANSFAAPVDWLTGRTPTEAAITDVDLDGRSDLVVASWSDQLVSVFRNVGTPGVIDPLTFADRVDFPTAGPAQGVLVQDLDADGRPDVVVPHRLGGPVSIFKNLSSPGSFTTESLAPRVELPGDGNDAVAGDFNQDGKPDLAVVSWAEGRMWIFENQTAPGAITAESFERVEFYTGGSAHMVGIGDLDGDGQPDIVVSNEGSDRARIFRNLGVAGPITTDSFTVAVELATGHNPGGLAVGDLNGDGRPEVVTGNAYGNSLSIFENKVPLQGPPIIFSQPQSITVVEGSVAAFSVGASGTPPLYFQWLYEGDPLPNETNAQLVMSGITLAQAGLYTVAVSNSLGVSMSDPSVLTVLPAPEIPRIFSVDPQAGKTGSQVAILGENFSPDPGSNTVYFGATRAEVSSGALDVLEVVLPAGATYAPVTVTVNGLTAYAPAMFTPTFDGLPGMDSASFRPAITLPAIYPHKVAIGDLDGDGSPDLVMNSYSGGSVSVYRNLGAAGDITNSTFAAPVIYPTHPCAYWVTLGDLDGDGKLDIVVVNRSSDQSAEATDTVSVLKNTSQPGQITRDSFAAPVDWVTGRTPTEAAIGDIDLDGRSDLVTVSWSDQVLSVFHNVGSPDVINPWTLAARVDFPTAGRAQSVVVQDLDADGRPDFVVPHRMGGPLSIFKNISIPGSITPDSLAPRVDLPGEGNSVAAGDLNGDAKPDLAVGSWAEGRLSVYENQTVAGQLTLASFHRTDFSSGGSVHMVRIGDLDGDGRPDIVTSNEGSDRARVFRNVTGSGPITTTSFMVAVDLQTGRNPGGLALGDLNGDGRPEVVTGNSYGNTVSIFQNQVPLAGPPVLLSQPQNLTVNIGSGAILSVAAGGIEPLSYQWYFNGNPLTDQTNSHLTLQNVGTNHSGQYYVVVSNPLGQVSSATVTLTINPVPACASAPSGLVSWWPGDGDGMDVVGGHPGVRQGDLGFGEGQVVGAFEFDGVDDALVVAAAPGLDVGLGEGFTLETWMRPRQVENLQPLVEWTDGIGGIGAHFWMAVEANVAGGGPGCLYANLVDDLGESHPVASPAGQLQPLVYQHVALTYDRASGWARLYRNGQVVGQAHLGSFVVETSGDLYLGLRPAGDFAGLRYSGGLDEVSVYNRALAEEELAAIYEAGAGGKCRTAQAPSLTRGPESLVVAEGGQAAFVVVAAGTPPLSYQWWFDGTVLEGATEAALALDDVRLDQAGWYAVVVSSPYGSVTSQEALLTVESDPVAPAIVRQPQSQSVVLGGQVSFTVEVSGTSPFTYQWEKEGVALPGETSRELSLVNVQSSQAGSYRVVVSNTAGSVTSAEAVLTVETGESAPYITHTAGSVSVLAGEEVVLEVGADGGGPLSYQWYWNGGLLAEATESELVLTNLQVGQGGTYTVVVSNPYGSVTNLGIVVDVNADWSGGTLVFGNSRNNAVYDVDGLTPLPVGAAFLAQLYAGPVFGVVEAVGAAVRFGPLPGVFLGGLRYIPTVSPGERVMAQVKVWESAYGRSYEEAWANGGRTGASSVFEMTTGGGILPPPSIFGLESFVLEAGVGMAGPSISGQPQDQNVLLGQDIVLRVEANGPGSLAYQWYRDGTALPGATGAELVWPGASLAQAGDYWAVVRNAGGAVTSAVATVTVEVAQLLALGSPVETQEGDLVSVPVELISQGNVGGMTFILRYDPDYLSGPEVSWSEALDAALTQAHVPVVGELWMVFALPGTTVNGGTQQLATVTFRARTVPEVALSDLVLEVVDVSDGSGELIAYGTAVSDGSVQIIGGGEAGDNNGNGRLDVGDATLLMRLLSQLDTVRSWDIERNDLNGNGVLDVGDLIKLLLAVVEEPMEMPLAGLHEGGGEGGGISSEVAFLSPAWMRGTNGQLVRVEVWLEGMAGGIAGASFTLTYPVEALRLVEGQSTGFLVPGDAVAVWQVAGGYGEQSGQVRLAVSGRSAWPMKRGILAELTFAVQPGAATRYLWPVMLSGVEVSADGYGTRIVASQGMEFEGRDPLPGGLAVRGLDTENAFEFVLEGDAGATYVVEASEDLVTWTVLTVVQHSGESQGIRDPEAANFRQRFYRVHPLE